jgi:hypothetical protein
MASAGQDQSNSAQPAASKGTSESIGKTTATEISANSVSDFQFWIKPGTIINPFDFVSVEHVMDTRTIGLIKEMKAITDAPSHLSNFVSSEFGNVTVEPNTLRIGTTLAKATVMANTGIKVSARTEVLEINMPVGNDRSVRFATASEVELGLGITGMRLPIPAGLIEMSNGVKVPVMLDADYLVGPEAAHVNISGISGLATKTSYLMFLIQSLYQRLGKENLALIIFNVKQQDLLHIDEFATDLDERDKQLYKDLGLEPKAFAGVEYYLPRGPGGKPNSDHVPGNSKVYAYELKDVATWLNLLFSEIEDPQFTLESITGYIRDSWPLHYRTSVTDDTGKVIRKTGQTVDSWEDLALYRDYPQAVVTHEASLMRFVRHLQRFRRSSLLVNSRGTNAYLGEEIGRIQPGQIAVVDIARITSTEEQAFVIGDVMRNLDKIYAEGRKNRPAHIIILLDELNRYAPNKATTSAVTWQIIEIARTGRSRGTVLFGAQQFKSAVHLQVNENSGTHVVGRTGSSELTASQYRFLDDDTKNNVTRLGKGELILVHPVFRQPVKIVFPRPAYKRQERAQGEKPKPLFMGAT